MTEPVRLAVGSTFAGDYKVSRALFEGEARAVYAVEQLSTGKELALKIIAAELVPDEESKQRFLSEVRVGGKIATEHVVDVRAAGVDAATGLPWLVMEKLDGEDLSQTLEKSKDKVPLPAWDELLSQLLRGLSAVHAAGCVHGGITPQSLFLAVPGSGGALFRVELLDLGIPKVARGRARGQISSLPWLAPEQVSSEGEPTPAADVWAVALIAFRLLSGKHYFKAANAASIDVKALGDEIATGALEPATARARALGSQASLPRSFNAWFQRSTSLSPADRYPDAAAAFEGATDLLAEASAIDGEVVEVPERSGEVPPIAAARRTKPPPLPPMAMVRVIIKENPKPAFIAISLLLLLALGGGLGIGALRSDKRMSAHSPRARAFVWARGDIGECTRACDGGDSVACHGLGLMHLYGTKVPQSYEKAVQLFQKACDNGDMAGCGSLAARFLNGEGVTEDKGKAAELYRRACKKGENVSCVDLADMYQSGNGVPKDEAEARALNEQACKAGFTEVCK